MFEKLHLTRLKPIPPLYTPAPTPMEPLFWAWLHDPSRTCETRGETAVPLSEGIQFGGWPLAEIAKTGPRVPFVSRQGLTLCL